MVTTIVYTDIYTTTVNMNCDERNFYVDYTGGDDGNDGRTPATAWKTFTNVNAGSFIGGDKILLKRGEHWHERIVLTDIGDVGNPIVIGDYDTGALPLLDGTGVTIPVYSGMIDYHGSIGSRLSNIWIENIAIQNAGQATNNVYNAIYMRYVDNIVITGCDINNVVDSGIMIRNCTNFTIFLNTVKNCANCTENMDESISIDNSTDGWIYENEVSSPDIDAYEWCSIGICLKGASERIDVYKNIVHHMCGNGIYPSGWTTGPTDIWIHENIVYDCEDYGIPIVSEQGGALTRIYVYNNLIYRIGKIGITIQSSAATLTDLYVYNNTIVKSLLTFYSAIDVMTSALAGTILIRNNCCFWHDPNLAADTYLGQIRVLNSALAKCTIDHNIVYGENDYQSDPGEGRPEADNNGEETWADPLFTDWANDVYTLQAGSPCRNAGTTNGLPYIPTLDVGDDTRICGSAIDVGCYEYQE